MKKAAIAVVVLVILIGAASFWLWPRNHAGAAPGGGAMPPPAVTVHTVKTESIALTQDLPGRTQAFKVAEIRPQVTGIIIDRLFEEGSDVTEGQQLYQIDPAPYQAAYDSAAADLQKAEANTKSTEAKEARYQKLVKIGGVSKQEYDDMVATLAQSKADVAIATAALATAKINLDYTKVFSPINGRIGKSAVTEGALVTAGQSAPLATVQQLDKIYVDLTQSAADLRKMRRSADSNTITTATLIIEGETEPYAEEGTVQFADVTVDAGTGTVQLRALFDNPRLELLPGLFVKARIAYDNRADAILVPQQAVARNPDGSTTVFTVDAESKVAVTPVTLGQAVGNRWLIESGLTAGDRVIVEGTMKVGPGAPVNPAEQGAPAPEQPAP